MMIPSGLEGKSARRSTIMITAKSYRTLLAGIVLGVKMRLDGSDFGVA
jgi:hypothetical protein